VTVNVTDIRSDAIIVTNSTVTFIELLTLTETDAIKWIREDLMTYKTPEEKGKKNKRYIRFLSWLWSNCVEVILQKINNGRRPNPNHLPRIWWIDVGITSYLPFHAAGDHSVGSTENALHWAISSYTPTIKALAHARERISATGKFLEDKPKLLIVVMPEIPGQIGLPGVKKEMSAIQRVVKSSFSEQSLIQPNAETVLAHLTQCSVIHFTCHGMSDEVIHLASGFQVAGFSHVIASMWATDDEVCVKMAREFYGRLKNGYTENTNNKAVAAAVHESIMEIRSVSRRYPLLWAPYVHQGA
jgi:hypothetical protein